MPSETSSNPPEHTIRVGDVEAALWRKDGEYGPMYSVKLSRSYRNESNEKQNTPYLGANDLNDGIRALSECVEYVSKMKRDFKYQQSIAANKKAQQEQKQPEYKQPAEPRKKKAAAPGAEASVRDPGQEG